MSKLTKLCKLDHWLLLPPTCWINCYCGTNLCILTYQPPPPPNISEKIDLGCIRFAPSAKPNFDLGTFLLPLHGKMWTHSRQELHITDHASPASSPQSDLHIGHIYRRFNRFAVNKSVQECVMVAGTSSWQILRMEGGIYRNLNKTIFQI